MTGKPSKINCQLSSAMGCQLCPGIECKLYPGIGCKLCPGIGCKFCPGICSWCILPVYEDWVKAKLEMYQETSAAQMHDDFCSIVRSSIYPGKASELKTKKQYLIKMRKNNILLKIEKLCTVVAIFCAL